MDEVRRLRKLKGLTQVDLAERAGVSAFTITEIETGRREPRPSTLRKLADALDAEVADFFPKAPAPPPLEDGARVVRGMALIHGSAMVRVSGEVIHDAVLDVVRRHGLLGDEDADAFAEEVAEEVARRAA